MSAVKRNNEYSLKESEDRYRSIFESAVLGIINLKRDGGFIDVNPSLCNFLGYSKEELMKMNIMDLTHPEDLQKTRRGVQDSKHGERVEIEKRYIRKDGKVVWGRVSSSWINSPSGEVSIAIIQDITERKKADALLREAEEKYRNIIENAVEGIFQTAPDGSLLMVNPAYARIFGFDSPQEMITAVKDIRQVYVDPEQRAEVIRLLNEQGIVRGFEGKAYRKDGNVIWVSSNVRAIRNAQGNLLYLEGSLEDITRRKELERQILQAQKLESLGVLAGGIAHDFNNILTAILGNISLAKSFVESKEQLLNRLTEAEKASLRASELARQLLTFSKGGTPIKKLVSIQSVIEHSVQFALSGSNIQSHFFIQEGLWPVEVDEGQIGQVIHNLVINAQQAMPEGGTIRLEVKNLTIKEYGWQGLSLRKGNYLFISIQDQGTGISKENLSKIFDPYFTTKQKGSGLGLSITYSIIQRHHGYITVESNPGAGTTFFICLPASSEALLSPEKSEVEAMTRGKGKILVMDDEESVLHIAGETLKHLEYEVDLAKNGTEAVGMYKKAKDSGHPFDVVITDLTVPGDIGGVETLRRLKEIDPKVKVIVSSGYYNDPAMAEFKSFGFSDSLRKPYRAFEVSQTVNRVLKTRRSDV